MLIIEKNYKILYCNDNALQKFPCVKVGELCYHAVRDEKKPCHDCPLQLNSNSTRPIFYNRKINQWQEINSAIIDWLNYKDETEVQAEANKIKSIKEAEARAQALKIDFILFASA